MSLSYHIGRNSLFNFLGQVIPAGVGLFAIPLLIQNLGLERFGILTVIWAIIGYFSLFDFGLSRVITYRISAMKRLGDYTKLPEFFWSSQKLILLFTILGAGLLFLLSQLQFLFLSHISAELLSEGVLCLQIMALTLPAVTITSGFRGLLEGQHKFLELNVLQAIQGILNFAIPLAISFYSPQLTGTVVGLSLLRYLFCVIHGALSIQTFPSIRKISTVPLRESLNLIKEGGWYTISNIVGPLMVYFDRFFLAMLFPASQIAYYTTPFEIVNRMLIIPSSLTRTLFPTFATTQKGVEANQLYVRSIKTMFLIMMSIALVTSLLARIGFSLWLGDNFAKNSTDLFIVLVFGVAINAVAWIPFTLIQGFNRPDLTAKLHLIELPIYIGFLVFLTSRLGLIGAAYAWSGRNLIDLLCLLKIAARCKKI